MMNGGEEGPAARGAAGRFMWDYFCSIFTGLKGHETMVSVAILVIYGVMAYMGTYLFASINSLIVVVMMVAVAVYIVLGIPNIDASQLSIGEAFGSGIKISSIGAAVSVFASCLSGGTAVSQIAEYSQKRLQRKTRMVFRQEF